MPIVVGGPLPVGTGLDLTEIWLNPASDPADMCSFEYVGQAIQTSTTLAGVVRKLANRRRVVRTDSRTYEDFELTLEGCDPDQVNWLKEHTGQLMCIRDHVGSKVYVVYFQVPREVETMVRDYADVKLTLEEIDHSEAV